MTFKELQDDTLERLGYDATQASSVPRTRIKRFLNQWQRRLLADPMYTRMRHSKLPFATVASQAQYGIPPVMEVINRIYDAALGNPGLQLQTPDWLRQDNMADINTGTPWAYVNYGLRPISRMPATTGTGIWMVSSSAADVTQTIRMDAIRVGGYNFQAPPAALNGTTRVQISSRTDYTDITKIFLSATAAGDVSLFDAAAAGNTLGVIPIGKLYSRYQLLQLYPIPSSVITYTIEGQVKIFDMAQDVDEPLIPEDFHHLLGIMAYYMDLRDVRKQLAQAKLVLDDDIKPEMNKLLDFLINTPDYIIVPQDWRSGPGTLGSNLGSWFPKGRW